MNAQQVDMAIKAEMERHLPDDGFCHCDDERWPCRYVIQASITLKLSAIANILSADQAAIIQGVIANGKTARQSEG